jgi:hypothetical protein
MTKFAMISMNGTYDSKNLKTFNKKFTAERLKKQMKCTEVIDLLANYDEDSLKLVSNVDADTFENLVHELCDFNITSLDMHSYYGRNTRKYVAFSDDASSTSFAFEKLKDDVTITMFEIDEDNVDTFIANIENIKSNSESIENLNEAKEALETLQNFENELSLNLIRSNAEEEIDSKTEELETEVEDAREQISELLMWS